MCTSRQRSWGRETTARDLLNLQPIGGAPVSSSEFRKSDQVPVHRLQGATLADRGLSLNPDSWRPAVIAILTDVVLIVTGFQLLLLAAVLLFLLPRHSLRRNLLAAFLLSKAFLILRWFALRFGLLDYGQHPGLYLISCAGFFLLAPLLYLYIRALCFRDFRLRWPMVAHLAPFAAMAVLAAVATAVRYAGFATGSQTVDEILTHHFWAIFWTANLTQIVLYVVAMFSVVRRYRARLGDVHSAVGRIDLSWLVALLIVISLHWLFVTSRSMLALLDIRAASLTPVLDLFSITIFLVFTTVLVVKGLAHVKLFPGLEEASRSNGSPLSESQLERCTERLLACMRFEKPHLDPSLTVDELALKVSMPSWQLSRVLNSAFGKNFFHFINTHRVEEAKRQLRDPTHNAKTMLQILHEAGFNSKSTFNDAFKRHTGMTPSEYRRRTQQAPVLAQVVPGT
jgi:AraC-like DNA-binding protein